MKRPTTGLLAALVSLGLSACEIRASGDTPEAAHTPTPPKAETGYVTGKAMDMQGDPIADAKILLDNTVFHASYINGSTGPDGSYRIKAQPGAWRAEASIARAYNGRTYTLDLHPDTIDAFNEEGAVRNFTWKLEGRSPKNEYAYYGGFIQLSTDFDFNHGLENIELALTPDGPLIDGSAGKTLRLRLGDHYWIDRYQVEDIPIGRYTVVATLKQDGGDRRLRIQDWHTRGAFTPEFQLDFIPKPGTGIGNAASIVIGE